MKVIPLSRPDITAFDKRKVLQNLNSLRLSRGPLVDEFEARVADFVGRRYAVAVNSGTSALHLIVKALGLKKGDEVITTPFSFIASTNCLYYEGIKPVFVDIRPDTLNIDPDKIVKALSPRTKAILAVDIFGHPADWDALTSIARQYGLRLIEDSCEAFGSVYKGRKAGSFGDAAAFAFYPNKQMTTAEGGVVVTDLKAVADRGRCLRNQGHRKEGQRTVYREIGYSYRLSDIHCALGLSQLEQISRFMARRARVAAMYQNALSSLTEFELPYIAPEVTVSWFVYAPRLKKKYRRSQRDKLLLELSKNGIECNVYFEPIHMQPFYKKWLKTGRGDFPVTESAADRILALPFHNRLSADEVKRIARQLKKSIIQLKHNPRG